MEKRTYPDARCLMAEAVKDAYARGQDDETMEPLLRLGPGDQPLGRIGNGHTVIFYNIRGEREIQLTKSLTDPSFHEFPRPSGFAAKLVTMIEYSHDLNVKIAFPPIEHVSGTLCETISQAGLRQVKIVESEKGVHLTYYLNGKAYDPFPGEDRIIVPSSKEVKEFDLLPEMYADKVSDALLRELSETSHDVIIGNFANTDVVGHTETKPAILKAIETVDRYTGIVVEAARKAGVTTIITADHGTVEKWLYPDGTIDTGHTTSPVPFILIDPTTPRQGIALREQGELTDVAPTVLDLLGLPIPSEMTGRSLLEKYAGKKGRRRILLLILDGWGSREETHGNLIHEARTPVMDSLQRDHPFLPLAASGEVVGLPPGTVGNSESGHLHIGSGRRIYADRTRIKKAIEDGSYYLNEAFLWATDEAKKTRTPLHLLGIISFYSSHGSVDYLLHLLRLAKQRGVPEVYVHSLLGRRGEKKDSGAHYIEMVEKECESLGLGQVVSVIGRYWALDREEHWDRVGRAFRLLVEGEGTEVEGG
jgi:2,3-bisphosphoglycerate-independent phosphoglycerate mutase